MKDSTLILAEGQYTGILKNVIETDHFIVSTTQYDASTCNNTLHSHKNPHICLLFQGADIECKNDLVPYQRVAGDIPCSLGVLHSRAAGGASCSPPMAAISPSKNSQTAREETQEVFNSETAREETKRILTIKKQPRKRPKNFLKIKNQPGRGPKYVEKRCHRARVRTQHLLRCHFQVP